MGKDSSVLTGDLAPLTLSFATHPVKKVKNSTQQLQKIRRTNFWSLRTNLRLLILTRSIRVSVCVLGSLRLLSLDPNEQNKVSLQFWYFWDSTPFPWLSDDLPKSSESSVCSLYKVEMFFEFSILSYIFYSSTRVLRTNPCQHLLADNSSFSEAYLLY